MYFATCVLMLHSRKSLNLPAVHRDYKLEEGHTMAKSDTMRNQSLTGNLKFQRN